MASLLPEWTAFVAQHPSISHDDPQRNGSFYANPANSELLTKVHTNDTTVPGRDHHPIPIRVYTAKETVAPRGLVVFFHSGGFVSGSLETEDIFCRYMALAGPLSIISVEYRLSPEHVYPVPLNDAWDTLEYILHNIATVLPHSLRPLDLIIAGTSSGGQLAGIVSQQARVWLDENANESFGHDVKLTGVLLRAPVTVRGDDPRWIPSRYQDLHHSWSAELETLRLDRADALGVPVTERCSPKAYPLWGKFENLPRTYIQLCDIDILRDDGVCYAQALSDAGVEVRQSLYKAGTLLMNSNSILTGHRVYLTSFGYMARIYKSQRQHRRMLYKGLGGCWGWKYKGYCMFL
ncbi:Alpha/Beta hydrolase protein [Stachybotrys elegans]|uniref:Alpha/Beta hydrolase protein n=1 Tax=Stachybotrys elegans TaxID=80388 RepID=A0A8K0SWA0_9HYPO|nr:Alpha/Beta hydrolase protein [Stachybotrys elegans]